MLIDIVSLRFLPNLVFATIIFFSVGKCHNLTPIVERDEKQSGLTSTLKECTNIVLDTLAPSRPLKLLQVN